MAKQEKPDRRLIPIVLHPVAYRELDRLDAATRADVMAILGTLKGKTHQELVAMLDPRTERKVCQFESSNQAGTLRVVFAWGAACLWFIGAFVKTNDREGERIMLRILPRANHVKNQGPKQQ